MSSDEKNPLFAGVPRREFLKQGLASIALGLVYCGDGLRNRSFDVTLRAVYESSAQPFHRVQ